MKIAKLLAPLVLVGGLLASCALIPPIDIGTDALGYTNESLTMNSFSTLDARGVIAHEVHFDDSEKPDMPVAPVSIRTVQGFGPDVDVVIPTGSMPDTITILEGSKLSLKVEEDSGAVESVQTETAFGPLTLSKADGCAGPACTYTFDDPEAAAEALTTKVSGKPFARLLQIIFEGGPNTLTLTLTVDVDTDTAPDSMTFDLVVKKNEIRF